MRPSARLPHAQASRGERIASVVRRLRLTKGGCRGTGKFIERSDAKFRNARFKLIPAVAKGPWVVQKSVGTTPLIVGGALKVSKGVACCRSHHAPSAAAPLSCVHTASVYSQQDQIVFTVGLGSEQIDFHQGERWFEVDVDIGSSAVANSVVRFVLGYARYIVVDMAYLIQGNSEEELPEQLIGALRVAHLDINKATEPPPEHFV